MRIRFIKKEDRRAPPQARRFSDRGIDEKSDHATADHNRGRITGAVPARLPIPGLSGEAEVIEVFAQELIIELREEVCGCGWVDGDDLVNDLFARESRGRGLHEGFA